MKEVIRLRIDVDVVVMSSYCCLIDGVVEGASLSLSLSLYFSLPVDAAGVFSR